MYCLLARFRVADLVNIYIWTRIATSILTLLAVWALRRKMPSAPRQFRVPGGGIGIASAIFFPAVLCAVKIYYSEPFVWRWAPWLLAAGPVAYCIFRWGLLGRRGKTCSCGRSSTAWRKNTCIFLTAGKPAAVRDEERGRSTCSEALMIGSTKVTHNPLTGDFSLLR